MAVPFVLVYCIFSFCFNLEKGCLKQGIDFLIFRQEDRDAEHEPSHEDMLEKLAHMSINDASLTDWHLGFHISLVNQTIFLTLHLSFRLTFFCNFIC